MQHRSQLWGGGTGWWRHWVPRGRADDGKLASVEVPVSWECSCSIWGLLLVGYLSCLVLWASGASVNYLTAFNTFSAQTSSSESIACNKGCWQVQTSLRGSLVLPTQAVFNWVWLQRWLQQASGPASTVSRLGIKDLPALEGQQLQ